MRIRQRAKIFSIMCLLTVAAPVPLYFGIIKKDGTSIRQEYSEYLDCWKCLCLMMYCGEMMSREGLVAHKGHHYD